MKKCKICGKDLEDNASVCSFCGAKLNEYENNHSSYESQNDQSRNYHKHYNGGEQKNQSQHDNMNLNDITHEFDKRDIESNKMMGVLSYLWILVFIPIFAAQNSKFARFHANQGLVIFIINVIWSVITGIVASVTFANYLIWGYNPVSGIMKVVNVVFLIYAILGIVYAVTGRAVKLPLIGNIKIIKY